MSKIFGKSAIQFFLIDSTRTTWHNGCLFRRVIQIFFFFSFSLFLNSFPSLTPCDMYESSEPSWDEAWLEWDYPYTHTHTPAHTHTHTRTFPSLFSVFILNCCPDIHMTARLIEFWSCLSTKTCVCVCACACVFVPIQKDKQTVHYMS